MFCFIRSTILYLILFVGLSFGIQKGFQHYYASDDEVGAPTSLTFGMPSFLTQARTTQTGLLLSGMTAQNRRDWGAAWQHFSTLNDKFDGNPTYALRAFTLALGNGEYDQALSIAEKLKTDFFDKDEEATRLESFDLVRLFLILNDVKAGKAEINLEQLKNGAVSKFITPILNAWLNPQSDKENAKGKDPIQIYHMALAADYHKDIKGANNLFDGLKTETLLPNQIDVMQAFHARHDMKDKLVNTDQEIANKTANNDFHLNGVNSGLSLAFHDFARALMSERAIDSALLFARMASFMDVQSPSVYVTIGNVLKYQNQNNAAMIAYEKVDENDSLYDTAVQNYVDILIQQDRLSDAESFLNQAIELNGENPLYHYLIGGVYKEQDKFAKSIEAYDAAESWGLHDGELERELWPLYYSRAIAFDLDDRWDDAERDLMTALDKFPNSPIILNYLGYAYADKNINLDKAKEMISQAVLAAPNDGYIIDSMGWILYRMGDYTEAVKYLERAARIRPYHMVINDHLGDAYWSVGRKLEAKYMWQRAVDYYDDTEEEQQRMIDETRRKVKEGL